MHRDLVTLLGFALALDGPGDENIDLVLGDDGAGDGGQDSGGDGEEAHGGQLMWEEVDSSFEEV